MLRQLARCLAGFAVAVMTMSAADVAGIWTGQMQGRRGEKEDVAFQFKTNGAAVTGKLFGDEFDLPVEEATVSDEAIKFIVTTTNYYSGAKVRFSFTGTIKGDQIELTRTRIGEPVGENPNRAVPPQTFTIRRLK
jgi:hypothetical protein